MFFFFFDSNALHTDILIFTRVSSSPTPPISNRVWQIIRFIRLDFLLRRDEMNLSHYVPKYKNYIIYIIYWFVWYENPSVVG